MLPTENDGRTSELARSVSLRLESIQGIWERSISKSRLNNSAKDCRKKRDKRSRARRRARILRNWVHQRIHVTTRATAWLSSTGTSPPGGIVWDGFLCALLLEFPDLAWKSRDTPLSVSVRYARLFARTRSHQLRRGRPESPRVSAASSGERPLW